MATTTDGEFPSTVAKMIESLRGDALSIAMDIGVTELTKNDRSAIKTLRDRMKDHVFPLIKDEVKSLYREGHREGGGVLSRQLGEPMKNYIQRRERWYTTLNIFDGNVSLSDEFQGDLLLLNAGISDI